VHAYLRRCPPEGRVLRGDRVADLDGSGRREAQRRQLGARQVDVEHGDVRRRIGPDDCGVDLGPYRVAYQTYGTLNDDKTNAILICHPLTCDQFVAEPHPVTGKPGWWSAMVGPGKVMDTDRYYVLCVNVLGGCMGSAGPSEINPDTGEPWGLAFPIVTIADMVRAQAMLLDHLGIGQLFAVIGGSMGGMQVLEWAALFPDRVFAASPVATAAPHTAPAETPPPQSAGGGRRRQSAAPGPPAHGGRHEGGRGWGRPRWERTDNPDARGRSGRRDRPPLPRGNAGQRPPSTTIRGSHPHPGYGSGSPRPATTS